MIEEDKMFYRKKLTDLHRKVFRVREEYNSDHLNFVRSCMKKGKNKASKSKRTITASEEDTHDSDVRSLIANFRRDISQLEGFIDILKGRALTDDLCSSDPEGGNIDVSSLNLKEAKNISHCDLEFLVHERTRKV